MYPAPEGKGEAADCQGRGDQHLERGDGKRGDTVAFARFSGPKIQLDNEDYLILGANDLLRVVE